jgi:hypothetical protein
MSQSPTLNLTPAFVGTRRVESAEALRNFLENDLHAPSRYYFLRWLHRVSGFVDRLPEGLPSPAGECLTPEFELRWQQKGTAYELLLLHTGDEGQAAEQAAKWGFQPLQNGWQVSAPQAAHLHPKGPHLRPKPVSQPENSDSKRPGLNRQDTERQDAERQDAERQDTERQAAERQDTKFPKPFQYPTGLSIQQRYFHDRHTHSVHFVALTLA